MVLSEFEKKVLETLKKVPRGQVTTYAELARAAGYPGSCRAVGNALNKNPWAPRVPCHRVVKSGGGLGGYAVGQKKKACLLTKEGIKLEKGKIADFNAVLYKFY